MWHLLMTSVKRVLTSTQKSYLEPTGLYAKISSSLEKVYILPSLASKNKSLGRVSLVWYCKSSRFQEEAMRNHRFLEQRDRLACCTNSTATASHRCLYCSIIVSPEVWAPSGPETRSPFLTNPNLRSKKSFFSRLKWWLSYNDLSFCTFWWR